MIQITSSSANFKEVKTYEDYLPWFQDDLNVPSNTPNERSPFINYLQVARGVLKRSGLGLCIKIIGQETRFFGTTNPPNGASFGDLLWDRLVCIHMWSRYVYDTHTIHTIIHIYCWYMDNNICMSMSLWRIVQAHCVTDSQLHPTLTLPWWEMMLAFGPGVQISCLGLSNSWWNRLESSGIPLFTPK